MPLYTVSTSLTMVTNATVTIAMFVLAHFWPGQDDPYQLAGWGNTPLGDQRQMPTKR